MSQPSNVLIHLRQEITDLNNGNCAIESVCLHEVVDYQQLCQAAQKIYQYEMDERTRHNDDKIKILMMQNDLYLFSDHESFFTNLSYLVAYLTEFELRHDVETIIFLMPSEHNFLSYLELMFPNVTLKPYGQNEKPPKDVTNKNKKQVKNRLATLNTFIKRVNNIIKYELEMSIKNPQKVIVKVSDRYDQQIKFYINNNENTSKALIFDWQNEPKFQRISIFRLLYLNSIYLSKVALLCLMILILDIKGNYRTELHKCSNRKTSLKTLINIIILYVFSCRTLREKTSVTGLVFLGLNDVMSSSLNVFAPKTIRKIYIRQNIQCATLEPVMAVHDKVLVPDSSSKRIFEFLGKPDVIVSNLCLGHARLSQLKNITPLEKDKVKVLYIDESIPRDKLHYEARMKILLSLQEISKTCDYELVLRPHPTTQNNTRLFEDLHLKLSLETFEDDLREADILAGRQSTALLLSIKSWKPTIICDPSNSPFYKNNYLFYNMPNSIWTDKVTDFQDILRSSDSINKNFGISKNLMQVES